MSVDMIGTLINHQPYWKIHVLLVRGVITLEEAQSMERLLDLERKQ